MSNISPASNDMAAVTICSELSMVILMSILAPMPRVDLQVNQVSAVHTVYSHLVLPNDTCAVYIDGENPDPVIVVKRPPAVTKFTFLNELMMLES